MQFITHDSRPGAAPPGADGPVPGLARRTPSARRCPAQAPIRRRWPAPRLLAGVTGNRHRLDRRRAAGSLRVDHRGYPPRWLAAALNDLPGSEWASPPGVRRVGWDRDVAEPHLAHGLIRARAIRRRAPVRQAPARRTDRPRTGLALMAAPGAASRARHSLRRTCAQVVRDGRPPAACPAHGSMRHGRIAGAVTAVASSTPSQPSSMAARHRAVPIPASQITAPGPLDISKLCGLRCPSGTERRAQRHDRRQPTSLTTREHGVVGGEGRPQTVVTRSAPTSWIASGSGALVGDHLKLHPVGAGARGPTGRS